MKYLPELVNRSPVLFRLKHFDDIEVYVLKQLIANQQLVHLFNIQIPHKALFDNALDLMEEDLRISLALIDKKT